MMLCMVVDGLRMNPIVREVIVVVIVVIAEEVVKRFKEVKC
jgi:hypothetical protein